MYQKPRHEQAIHLRLSADDRTRLETIATRYGVTISQVARWAIAQATGPAVKMTDRGVVEAEAQRTAA